MVRRRALVEPPARQWQRHLAATLIVTDDFGDAVGHVRRCSACREFKPLDLDHFGGTGRDERALGYQRICRTCERAAQDRRRNADREAHRRRSREGYRRRMRDPENRERLRERERAYRERQRERDPERVRALARERHRRYLERIKSDPERLRRLREAQRIDRVLRKMRNGASFDELFAASERPEEYGGYVPVAPVYEHVVLPRLTARLGEAVAAFSSHEGRSLRRLPDMNDLGEMRSAILTAAGLGIGVVGYVASEIGVSDRTINAWVRGARPTVRISVVDTILDRTGLFWWDLVSPGDPCYAAYAGAFGDVLEEAA